jgi:hypothetical protein
MPATGWKREDGNGNRLSIEDFREYTLNRLTKTENTAETIIPYDGKVYCIEMPTTNIFFQGEHIFAADDVWK